MGIRQWLRKRMLEEEQERSGELPAARSLFQSIFGREAKEPPHALGEYTAKTYPQEMAELLRRREEVAQALMRMNLTDPKVRRESVPQIKEQLRKYPHPLAYESLILAYIDLERWDDALGVAFAARERRRECARSDYPEICAETSRLREWTPQDIEELRAEREGRLTTPGVPVPASAQPAPATIRPATA
jgi:hypothetical protein